MTTHANKVALITGAGRGIGQALADAHAAASAKVAYLDHDPNLAEEAATAARARGWAAFACAADVADFASISAACARIEDELGPIDILVNNAGISPKTAGRKLDVWAMDPLEWRRVVDVNLTGAFNCTRAAAPGMRARGSGRIVNISSVAGKTYCDIVGAHYAATKAALIGLTKHPAGELGPFGITVNALAPGRIDTPMARGVAPELNEAIRQVTPLRRLGTPEDVAAACLFFTSDAAGFITAQICDVSGGWLMT
jgi:3-oxoacyl-[acyl-carrier protein] reductase